MGHARAFGVVLGAFGLVPLAAEDRPVLSSAQRWVAQLADDAYQIREAATRQLIDGGLSARPAVIAALEDQDPEVRLRCQRILAEIELREEARILQAFLDDKNPDHDHGLSGWAAFREVAGDSAQTRTLYAELYKAERKLLSACGRRGGELSELFAARLSEVQQNLSLSVPGATGSRRIPLLTAMALLFVAGDQNVSLDNLSVHTLIQRSEVNPRLAAGEDRDVLRKLLGRLVARDVTGTMAYQNVNLALRFDLKEVLAPAVKLAREEKATAVYRLYALLAVAKFGARENCATIEPLLADVTGVSSRGGEAGTSPQFKTQLRDVALAAMIHLRGGKPEDFGMPARSHPHFLYFPNSLGFTSDAERDSALAKYRAWVEAGAK